MALSNAEKIAQKTTDALHEAIRLAWQAGYDQALQDMVRDKDFGAGRVLHRAVIQELSMEDGE
jgi:hypothetical protein